mgnify:CR=1 FL=1
MPLFIESVIVGNAWFAASCRLHIVGRCSPRIDALIVRYRLAETVIAHGFLSGKGCLLYASPSPRDRTRSRMPASA